MKASIPLRIGVVGLGRAFTLMLPTFLRDTRVRLVAACDPRNDARTQFVRDFGVPVYESADMLASDTDVEIVYVASPHQYHAEHSQIAAAHGKHVLVEKPMALTVTECDEMIDACNDAGVQLIVGHSHSFDTPYLRARKIIDSGEFGRVRMVHSMNFTDFLYRPRRLEELRTELGGGIVFNQAAHQIDVVRLLAGGKVLRVRAVTGQWDTARPTEGAYSSLLWFEDGAFASLSYSGYGHFDSDEYCDWIDEMGQGKDVQNYGKVRQQLAMTQSASDEARTKIEATYGGSKYQTSADGESTVSAHQHFGPMIISCERADIRPLPHVILIYGNHHQKCIRLTPPQVPRFEVIDELEAAVRHGQQPMHNGAWARSTLQVCHAILASSREMRDVEL